MCCFRRGQQGMAEGSSVGRAVVFNNSLQDGQDLLFNFVRNVCFDSRQKVGYFDFCDCKFYYLCHKPVSAYLWEFITVTVKDLSFKVFFIIIPVRKTLVSFLLKLTNLMINFTKDHFQNVRFQYKSTETYYLPVWHLSWQKFKIELQQNLQY